MYRINKPLFTKLNYLVLLLFVFCISQNIFAQKQKKELRWDDPFKIPDAVKPAFANNDAVILNEKIDFLVEERSENFTAVSNAVMYQGTTYKRNYQIKFLTKKGVEAFTKLSLPDSFNSELPDYNGGASRQLKFNDFKYYNCEIVNFKARVQKADKSVKNVVVKSNPKSYEYFKLGQKERYTKFNYELTEIEVGDVVEVSYELYFDTFLGYGVDTNFGMVDKMVSSSNFYHWWHYYFHSNIAKQKTELTIKWPFEYRLEWFYNNGADPTEILTEKKLKGLKWVFEELPAINLTLNNHAYKHLPNIYFYVHNLNFGKWDDSKLVEYEPYNWGFICHDAIVFDSDNKMLFQMLNAKERALNKIYKKLQESNAEPLAQVMSLHNEIANNFKYRSDANYYYGTNERINNLGLEINSKTISEEDRFEIYKGIFNRMGVDYYEAYIEDKRFGEIDKNVAILPHNAFKAIAVKLKGGQFVFMLPKTNKKGYWFQELPFYLENTTALLVKQNTDSFFNDENIYFLKTPFGTSSENVRNTSGQISVNLQNGNASFNTTQLLNGQFSSVLRHYITNKQVDATINPKYYKPLFNYGKAKKKIIKNEPLHEKSTFPFTCKKQTLFEITELAKTTDGQNFEISLDKMMNYFIPTAVNQNGKLPFYFDFLLTERYNFVFEFNEAIELTSSSNNEFKGVIDGVNYLFQVKQLNENSIKVESAFSVTTEKININELADLSELVQTMLANEKAIFTVKKKVVSH